MITREQVADLQPGDVVEFGGPESIHGSVIRGPLFISETSGALLLGGGWVIRHANGDPVAQRPVDNLTLTVVSRAPRPLYVNHDRTEPVPGDVVTYPDRHIEGVGPWFAHRQRDGGDIFWMSPTGPVLGEMPFPMRLLVDGETGQVVP